MFVSFIAVGDFVDPSEKCPVMALLGLSVTSGLSLQRVEQRTSPAAFDVAGLLVASSAIALNDAIICAGLAGRIG
jgi:hypothetical protein